MQAFRQDEDGGARPEPRKPPPEPSPQYATTAGTTHGAFVFENIPHVMTASDDEANESSFSLPEIPSPMPQPSPSMLMTSPGFQRPPGTLHSAAKSLGTKTAARIHVAPYHSSGNDEDTFCDDRSLEQRIQRTLGIAPKTPLDVMATPASVAVTPAAGHRTTPWNRSTTVGSSSSLNHLNLLDTLELDQGLQSHRSALTLVKLKQDLRNAMSNLYLLKQEKDAAESKAHELARQNELLVYEKKQVDGRAAAVAEERRAVEEARAQVNQELANFRQELHTVTDERDEMMNEIQRLRDDKETQESEYQELSQRMRALIREHQDDLKSFGDNTDTRVKRLKSDLEASRVEVEILKASLAHAEEKLAQSTQELEKEREKANAELVAMTEKHDTCLRDVERLELVIQEAKRNSNGHIQTLEQEQRQMELKQDADQLEITRLKEALKKAGSGDEGVFVSQPEMESQQRDMEALSHALQEADQQLARQQKEIGSYQDQLVGHQQEINRLETELKELKARGTSAIQNRALHTVACQTEHTGEPQILSFASNSHRRGPFNSTVSDPITERLLRIRDAAERAGLVKEHHRELARIREHHKLEMRELALKHEEAKHRAVKDAKATLESLHGDATEQLKAELEDQITELGRKHNAEVTRLNDEMQKRSEAAEESLLVAMTKLSSTKTKLVHEVARREKVEEDLISIEKQSAFERQRMIREQEAKIQVLKKTWDGEKRLLLEVIQRDCNLVFEQNKGAAVGSDSPRGVAIDFANDRQLQVVFPADFADSPKGKQSVDDKDAKFISPSYSEIDKELRATEAFVKSLLGKDINVQC